MDLTTISVDKGVLKGGSWELNPTPFIYENTKYV